MDLSRRLPAALYKSAAFTMQKLLVGEKVRTIAVPNARMRKLQSEFLSYLRDELEGLVLQNAMSARRGSLALDNALVHADSMHFYKLDFANAFPSVTAGRLAEVLHELIPGTTSKNFFAFLSRFCFVEGQGLAQGGAASPFLFDLYCDVLVDRKVRALLWERDECQEPTVLYTRYVDDLVFSSRHKTISPILTRRIRGVVREAGFEINYSKTATLDRVRENVVVTGFRLLPGPNLPIAFDEKFARKLEGRLDRCLAIYAGRPDNELIGLIGYYQYSFKVARWADNRVTRRINLKIEALRQASQIGQSRGKALFPEKWIRELKRRVSLLSFNLNKLKIRKEGKRAVALSVFRKEQSASMELYLDQGTVFDFGAGRSGDAIDLAMHIYDVSFVKAVLLLAKRVSLDLPPEYKHRKAKMDEQTARDKGPLQLDLPL